MKLIVGITGASGVELGLKFVKLLPNNIKTHLVISSGAKTTIKYECFNTFKNIKNKKNITLYKDKELWQNIASGSYQVDAMIILPCSMNTLAKCSVGICDTLITRAFSVMLKENKKTIIAPREMPYSQIALQNMTKLSSLGVIIAPPMLGYYSKQQTLIDMENFIIGKWFDLLGIKNKLYKRWDGKNE
jgi:4-hydroxy-3-polyprenylbenzoate decarboxylase